MNESEKKKYVFDVNSAPIAWLDYSEELKEIAELIVQNTGYSIHKYPDMYTSLTLERGFFLNYGFAIETLLKGLLIAENPDFVSGGQISKDISSNHNLVKLSRKISSINFENDEIELLEILSNAIPYWGRYPIPKRFSQVSEKSHLTKGLKEKLGELWFKIGNSLYQKIKFGWEGPSGVKVGPFISSTFENEEELKKSLEKLAKMKINDELDFGNIDTEKTTYNKAE